MKTEPRFDSYIFIERNDSRCAELEALKSEFPDIADCITVRKGDANSEIQSLCDPSKSWNAHRAVLFLGATCSRPTLSDGESPSHHQP